jgi:hypothetical protein
MGEYDMKRTMCTVIAAAAAAGLAVLAPQDATGQQSDGWWEWALRDAVEARSGGQAAIPLPRRDRPQDRARGKARGARGAGNARAAGGGPPFCANGQGHPVHGRQWCRDKGFGLGAGGILNRRWDDRGWDDVILRAPRGTDRRQGVLDRGGLIDVLGDVVFGRIVAEGSRLGGNEPLIGRWIAGDGGATVLQIRSGSVPVAELTDLTGNGRADAVLVPRP